MSSEMTYGDLRVGDCIIKSAGFQCVVDYVGESYVVLMYDDGSVGTCRRAERFTGIRKRRIQVFGDLQVGDRIQCGALAPDRVIYRSDKGEYVIVVDEETDLPETYDYVDSCRNYTLLEDT